MNRMSKVREIDYLIIGAGPAGLQLGYFMDRAGRDYLILDSEDRPGTFFESFPRHDKLLSINKVHTGYKDREAQLRYDWNSLISDDPEFAFTQYSGEYFASANTYAKYLRDYAQKFGLKIQYNTRAGNIRPIEPAPVGNSFANYEVSDQDGNVIQCRVLIVATGVSLPYIPEIPGIELTENYWDCSIDPADFAGQKVLVIGKGNSAFETANHLTDVTRVTHLCSPNSIKMAWKSHYFGHLRAVNNDFLDTYILKGQNSVLDASIDKIERDGDELVVDVTFTHAEGQRAQFAYDRVLVCTGFRWDPAIFADGVEPQRTACGKLPMMTSAWESTNLPNLYYAGTVMQMRDHHKTMSNVLHGFRFNVQSLAKILEERYEDQQWPAVKLPRCAEAMADKVIQRVSTNAGLMHQPGFLSDVMTVTKDAVYYQEILAVDYVHESRFGSDAHYYTITMEYGDTLDDLLSVNREPDPEKAYNDFYLHPRIQRFCGEHQLAEHHIAESLENEWRLEDHPGEKPLIRSIDFHGQEDSTKYQQTHREKLVAFFEKQLAAKDQPAYSSSASGSEKENGHRMPDSTGDRTAANGRGESSDSSKTNGANGNGANGGGPRKITDSSPQAK